MNENRISKSHDKYIAPMMENAGRTLALLSSMILGATRELVRVVVISSRCAPH
ncbi:hypothetical protein GF337_14840 [candidate division KSB1 bacterium]|nr:hypothetical protein [candidate division KSB1 bacterium]